MTTTEEKSAGSAKCHHCHRPIGQTLHAHYDNNMVPYCSDRCRQAASTALMKGGRRDRGRAVPQSEIERLRTACKELSQALNEIDCAIMPPEVVAVDTAEVGGPVSDYSSSYDERAVVERVKAFVAKARGTEPPGPEDCCCDWDDPDDIEPPEPDTRAPCRVCGGPVSDAEYDDNHGRHTACCD